MGGDLSRSASDVVPVDLYVPHEVLKTGEWLRELIGEVDPTCSLAGWLVFFVVTNAAVRGAPH